MSPEFLNLFKNAQKAKRVLREKGWRLLHRKFFWFLRVRREGKLYRQWIKNNRLDSEKRQRIKNRIAEFPHKPLISIILPVYNVEEKWLRLCIESVLKQIYENWELCIADDKSPAPHIRRVLEEYARSDKRIKVVFREKNGHISAASNSALQLATGEFCVLLDHDDELSEDALFYVAKELNDFPETAFIYSDEDMIDEQGRRFGPKFKPDFSRDLLYSLNLITHLSAYRTDILQKIGGFRRGLEGSQDYDLALRVLEEIDETQIRHIPRILYHWRAIRGSVAFSAEEKPYAHERARQAIREHLERSGKKATVSQSFYNLHRVSYKLPDNLPKVSLILFDCQNFPLSRETFIAETDYENLEIEENPKFSAESLNEAATKAKGEILCFVHAGLKPLSPGWLKELVSFVSQEEFGAVGAKILDKTQTVVGGGLIVGTAETVSVAHYGFWRLETGNMCRNLLISNFSAVSIFCLAVRRKLFLETSGFSAKEFPYSLFDADFCLKLWQKNLRVVLTPFAELIQTDKKNLQVKPTKKERQNFQKKWGEIFPIDRFYNPNFSLNNGAFAINSSKSGFD
jgi:glycosyltransferase involved in cell wall biosynthesis